MTDAIRPRQPLSARGLFAAIFSILGLLFKRRGVIAVLVVAVLLWIASSTVTTYVPPGMVGIRQVYFGSGAGLRAGVYQNGLYFLTPGAERLHLFPKNVQVVNFTDEVAEASSGHRTVAGIKIQTSDGYNVQLDVTVLYRIEDPNRVMTEAGPGRAFEDRLVVPYAERILRRTLGELNSEEFYQGPKRIDKAKQAHVQLTAELKAFGIHVDGVLLRRYAYDEKYQLLIEGRKIKDQTVFLRQAEAKAAIEQRKRDTIVSEGNATVQVELSRGEAEVHKLAAQADLYRRKQEAGGKLLVELAEAKGTELENAALQGAGSERMVGLKMADALSGVKVLVLSSDGPGGLNPLDLQSMLRKFGVQ